MDNRFDKSGDGDQNVGQGDGAVGKQVNITQQINGNDNIVAGGNVTIEGIPPEVFAEYVAKHSKALGETEQIVRGFLGTLLEREVPRDQWDSKLREIAGQYRELLARLETVQSEDPQVQRLKDEARQAIETGDYAEAEDLLNQAEALDVQAIEQMEKTARKRRISAAATNADQARLQRIQLRYARAAEYWQKAAALLPGDQKKERAYYLNAASNDFYRIAKYKEALALWEQSFALYREIGDKAGEGTTLSNIGALHHAKGDYTTALTYLERSLTIRQEISDKASEGATLNNISQIYDARGDYATALKYLEQSLVIRREIGDRAEEGTTLNNISQIYHARGDYATALKYLEQNLVLFREIGNKAHQGGTLNNISQIYHHRGDYVTALKYLEQSLVIRREIGDRAEEGTTLNNISQIYHARGDYATALKYLEQNLVLFREIGAKREEAGTNWNIGRTYKAQGDLAKAEQYMSRTVEIEEEIGLPTLEESRKALEEVRAEIKGR
ncbi:MAG: tetratricopeptide repeat protein [Candidatus Electrothrix sp. GW3-4]|uniref:tetratricopeptide repeat protein n=1 Tax=Candidatus Electrothrix sp. GW3-4 TaxID=3126740 RepID=UPI0030CEB0E0